MPGLKDLKKRIGSVKNTQQTTKAMKLVSAAKLRRSQEAIFANRPYAKKIDSLIRLVATLNPGVETNPLIVPRVTDQASRKVLLVSVSSDRGLCGGFNSNIIKRTQRFVAENKASFASLELAFVGKKAGEVLRARGYKPTHVWEFGRKATFSHAREICDWVVAKYLDGTYDEVRFLYNEFKNAITQIVVTETFLPIQAEVAANLQVEVARNDRYIVKPGLTVILDALLKKHFATQVFRILLESQASEHGARMSAMDSATRNAGEMIKKLSIQYNKQRQAGITKELLEIIAGAESQKG